MGLQDGEGRGAFLLPSSVYYIRPPPSLLFPDNFPIFPKPFLFLPPSSNPIFASRSLDGNLLPPPQSLNIFPSPVVSPSCENGLLSQQACNSR